MSTDIIPATNPQITATPVPKSATPTGAAATTDVASTQIAGNFNTFLQLLTTQLKNQNPLDPLDTNQFTQQLVSFAGVEQQINMNTQLKTMVALEQTAQATQALNFVGATVAVNGSSAQMVNSEAQWTYAPTSAANATFTITNSTGQTVFSQTGLVQPGAQPFTWNGIGNSGQQWPDGNYTLSVTAADPATGKSVAVPTQVNGVVDSVDLTQNPPMLSVGGQTFTVNQILRVIAPASKS
jgi:flagellar basal-body rod modification protein FlgD